MKVVIINGGGGVGKDTFVKICQKEHLKGKIWNISTIDPIKEAAKILGWNEEKDEKGRKFLSDLKDLATSYSDLSFSYISNLINAAKLEENVDVIFIHCREPEEIKRLKNKFNAITLLIKNNRIKSIKSNHADKNIENYNYDFTIENNDSLLDLTKKAIKFLQDIGVL